MLEKNDNFPPKKRMMKPVPVLSVNATMEEIPALSGMEKNENQSAYQLNKLVPWKLTISSLKQII